MWGVLYEFYRDGVPCNHLVRVGDRSIKCIWTLGKATGGTAGAYVPYFSERSTERVLCINESLVQYILTL